MNYCVHCGMKLEPNFRICPGCGTILKNSGWDSLNQVSQPMSYPYQNQVITPSERIFWKDVLSLVFNLLALFFCYVVYDMRQELYFEQMMEYGKTYAPYIIGALLWQIGFSVTAFCLSISSRKRKENRFNFMNIIFAAVIFAITIIEFGILISYSL